MAPDNQSSADSTPEPSLLALARKKFGALSRAEEELFLAAREGRGASVFFTGDDAKDNPANAANWGAERDVRAKCISWVCTDPRASALVTHRGLELYGMRIEGELDLINAEIKFPFAAWKCVFSERISLRDARLKGFFYLMDCQLRSVGANDAEINGSVTFRDCLQSQGEISLVRAAIGGDLDCHDGRFSNAKGPALTANGAEIQGSVFLSDGFRAQGEVNLASARIGKHLDCSGAEFSNAKGWALTANSAKIEGGVFFREGFKADGEVHLASARIGQSFECDGAQLSNPKGCALDANMAKVEGGVYLRSGFRAEGEVNLVAATMGNLQIHDILAAEQTIFDLRHAKVETFWDDEKSWPKAENLFLDGFRYDRLHETSPFDADSRKKWLSLQRRSRFRPQPFEQLSGVLRKMGHEPEARQMMIEKNRERAGFTHFPHQNWWWYNLFGRLIGYGYAPWRAFALSAALILLGTFLFHLGATHDLISPTSDKAYAKAPNGQVMIENGRQKVAGEYPVFNAFFYSLESFTPLLKLDQNANWAPNANQGANIQLFRFWAPRTGDILRYYLYLHIAAGWLLTSLWVGAVTGLVKT